MKLKLTRSDNAFFRSVYFLFVLFRGSWTAELSCYRDTFSVWSDIAGEPGHNISTAIKIKYQQRVQQETIMWAPLPSLESFNYILSVFNNAQLCLQSVVWLLIKIKNPSSPLSVCLQSQNEAELYIFTSPKLINRLYCLFIYARIVLCNKQICIFKFCTFANILCN